MSFKKHPAVSTDVLSYVSDKIDRALRTASRSLSEHGIRHAICGGIAVGAYGHVRATTDVDFVAGDEAFIRQGGLLTFAPGVPFLVGDIQSDMLPIDDRMQFLEDEINDPIDFDGMPLVSPEGLIAMKLISFRRRDQDDILSLLSAGCTSIGNVFLYLERYGKDDLVEKLARLVEE